MEILFVTWICIVTTLVLPEVRGLPPGATCVSGQNKSLEQLLSEYFYAGYHLARIAKFLLVYHGISLNVHQLKYRYKVMGLGRRRVTSQTPLHIVEAKIKEHIKSEMECEKRICISKEEETEINQQLQQGGIDCAKNLISDKLRQWKEQPLNVAIAGTSGSGKSSFINAIRNLTADDIGAAAVGIVECTLVPTPYSHPHNDQLKFWDLPGIGTLNFPKDDTYLENVGFDRYDFFLVLCGNRFTTDDIWLAMQIRERGKKCLFVKTKIDSDLKSYQMAHPRTLINEDELLQEIKDDIGNKLATKGFNEPKIFLISNFYQEKWDFPAMCDQLIQDVSQLKKEAMALSLDAFSTNMVKKKKEILQTRIWKIASLSAAGALIPFPEISIALDLALLTEETTFYKTQFGLSDAFLTDLSQKMKKKHDHLKTMLKSVGAISVQASETFIKKMLAKYGTSMAIEEAVRFIPNVIGALVSSAISFTCTVMMLREVLDKMEGEANTVMDVFVQESVYE